MIAALLAIFAKIEIVTPCAFEPGSSDWVHFAAITGHAVVKGMGLGVITTWVLLKRATAEQHLKEPTAERIVRLG